MMTDPNIGCILAGRYKLMSLIGQGSMGRVYGAKDELLGGVPVAVKFLSQTLLNQKMKERFEREARTCAMLGQKSSHIVRVTDYNVNADGVPFYVMEYLKGDSLNEIIDREPLKLPDFVDQSRQICLGLQCAHQGIDLDGELCPIVHRDIKPSNILVSPDETLGKLVKVLDFGIAKTLQEDSIQTNCFMGTLAYSSPEQMEGRELDARSDIYSLGVMMFQMLTGKMPLYADTHNFGAWYKTHRLMPPRSFESANSKVKLPKSLENLVMACLEKLPDNRPQNIAQIIRELEPLDNRYRPNRLLINQIQDAIETKPIVKPRVPSVLSPEDICRLTSWPKDKPTADIVFAQPLQTSKESLATLWVMLPKREIEKHLICTPYSRFFFLPAPHPVILWLTVLYSRAYGPRWLSCYLDLKNPKDPLGQRVVNLLAQSGKYRVLFFPKEEARPQGCVNVLTLTVKPAQCKEIQEWATIGRMSPNNSQYNFSKERLREELEQIKPKILMLLDSLYSGEASDVSG